MVVTSSQEIQMKQKIYTISCIEVRTKENISFNHVSTYIVILMFMRDVQYFEKNEQFFCTLKFIIGHPYFSKWKIVVNCTSFHFHST